MVNSKGNGIVRDFWNVSEASDEAEITIDGVLLNRLCEKRSELKFIWITIIFQMMRKVSLSSLPFLVWLR